MQAMHRLDAGDRKFTGLGSQARRSCLGGLCNPQRPCSQERLRLDVRLQVSQSDVVTDQAVPEGHKGLHEFLYGEGGAEAHDISQADIQAREVHVSIQSLNCFWMHCAM